MMPAYAIRTQSQPVEGIAVVGEAVKRIEPESAEFLVEITAGGHSVSQATANYHNLVAQVAQAVSGFGVHRQDLQIVSLNVANVFVPGIPGQSYGVPQIAAGPFSGFTHQPALQPDLQFGSYQARSLVRVAVKDAARVGEVADALVKSGASLVGGLCFKAADESGARRSALEAAGKDARSKAETLAVAAGKQLGDPVGMSEEVVASNGVYTAMRSQMPWAFGPDAPPAAGELEYYARVTASFRFQ